MLPRVTDGRDEQHHIGDERHARPDVRLAELAARRHGVVSSAELAALGLTRRAVERRVGSGRLHPVHRGVYAVGHRALTANGRRLAAVLAVGAGAVLSHRAAAALWGLRPSDVLEVTAPRQRRAPTGVVVHRSSTLHRDEQTVVDGIPVTSVPRTVLDLAAVVPPFQVVAVVHRAEVDQLADVLSLAALVERHPRRRGVTAIRRLLAEERLGRDVPKHELERRFAAFVDRHGLPAPERGVHLEAGGRLLECDAVWRPARLVVELDGRRFHDTTVAFERDRERDRLLAVAGWRVVRVTWRQLHARDPMLAHDLAALLSRPAGPQLRRA